MRSFIDDALTGYGLAGNGLTGHGLVRYGLMSHGPPQMGKIRGRSMGFCQVVDLLLMNNYINRRGSDLLFEALWVIWGSDLFI